VDTPSGQRDFNSSDVAQLHLAPLNRPTATSGQAAEPSSPASIPANSITVAANQTPSASGYYRQGVTFTFTCTDALSGIVSCPSAVTLGEGANQTVSGQTSDRAGNTDSVSVSGIKVDATAPTITGTPDQTETNGWFKAVVKFTFTCTDAVSLIKTCPAPITVGETAGQVVTATAEDNAGNTATFTKTVRVDLTDPSSTVGAAPKAKGGNITGSASDADNSNPKVVSGVDKVVVTMVQGSKVVGPAIATLSNCTTGNVTCDWAVPAPPSNGNWQVSVQPTDRAGRVGAVTQKAIFVP